MQKIKIMSTVLTLIPIYGATFGGYANAETKEAPYVVPWKTVAVGINEGYHFCYKFAQDNTTTVSPKNTFPDSISLNLDYIYSPMETLSIPLSNEQLNIAAEEIEIKLYQWKQDNWQEIEPIKFKIDSKYVVIEGGLPAEGYFQLSLNTLKEKESKTLYRYAIVCKDWKKDLLPFCQEKKSAIEAKRDPKLIYSSIATSHFDNTMELISSSSLLSGSLLRSLGNAVRAKQAFDEGKCPDLVKDGVTAISLKRFPGAQVAYFGIHLPQGFNGTQKYPLFLFVNPANWGGGIPGRNGGIAGQWSSNSPGFHENIIDLFWTTTSSNDLRWKDYKELLSILQEKLKIDTDRIFVFGFCRNGTAAMSLVLHHPDVWAKAVIDLGGGFMRLASNALNVNMSYSRTAHGGEDVFMTFYDFTAKWFKYYQCEKVETDKGIDWPSVSNPPSDWMRNRQPPKQVYLTVDSLGMGKAYWVQVLGRVDENMMGSIDAKIEGQKILVKTTNVDNYILDIPKAPIDLTKPINLIENGKDIGKILPEIFVRKTAAYQKAKVVKSIDLPGAIGDVLTEPFVVVYGSGGKDKDFINSSKAVGESLANGAPVYMDTEFPENRIKDHNLILIGTPETNSWLSKIAKDIPVCVKEKRITAKKSIQEEGGFYLVYPNPLNPKRYVAVFSATSAGALSRIPKTYAEIQPLTADVGIYEITATNEIIWHVSECFDTTWNWQEKWNNELAVVEKDHPKWQWWQWVANTIRTGCKVDGVFLKDPFKNPSLLPKGKVTFRDLFNLFQNTWIVKIQLKGNALRQLLMTSFSGEILKRADSMTLLIVDGISYSRQKNEGENVLSINEIKDGKDYTVALPYDFVNWGNLGITFKNYEIIGQGYLVSILGDYLLKNKLNMDARLDGMKQNPF